VDDDAIKENDVADPQLNGAKEAITTRDLDPTMILTWVHLGVSQESPSLSPGKQ
jgi:hypothetical protein